MITFPGIDLFSARGMTVSPRRACYTQDKARMELKNEVSYEWEVDTYKNLIYATIAVSRFYLSSGRFNITILTGQNRLCEFHPQLIVNIPNYFILHEVTPTVEVDVHFPFIYLV